MKNVDDVYPLSPTQQGMLFHSLYDPSEAGTYTGHISYDLHGALDLDAFERSWQRVVDRHAVLRTAFLWEGLDRPLQVVRQKVKVPFEHQDWRGLPGAVQEKWLAAFLKSDRDRGFDPKQAPLLRVAVIRLEDDLWKMVWSFHLMMVDGWSLPLLFNEVVAFYGALSRGRELLLPNPRPFRDYIEWLERQDLAQAEDYWRRTLAGFVAPTSFGVDRPISDSGGDAGERQIQLSAAATEALAARARRLRVTFNTLVQGAWALLLSRYGGTDDVVFGATASGRPPDLPGVEEMIGLFINTLPVRVRIAADDPVDRWLQALQAEQTEQRQFEYSPLSEIQKWSEIAPGRPLFESILVFENYPAVDRGLGEEEGGAEDDGAPVRLGDMGIAERTNYPLALAAELVPELVLRINFDAQRFGGAPISRMLAHLATLLGAMAEEGAGPLGEISVLSAAERHQATFEWSGGAEEYVAGDEGIVGRLARRARLAPDAAAVVANGEPLTYAELDLRAARLARHLAALGFLPGASIGVCFERSLEIPVALLAIWRAGCVYLPLDPAYPRERLAYMLEDSGAALLLTSAALAPSFGPGPWRVLALDETVEATISEYSTGPSEPPVRLPAGDDLAYLIYTSGTTGRPKAVAVTHANLLHTLRASQRRFAWGGGERMPHLASFSFDISLFELLNPLLSGGTAVLLGRDELLDLPRLLGQLEAATHLHAVPSLMRQIVAALGDVPGGAARRLTVRQLFVGGDQVPPDLLDEMRAAFPGARVFVLYGPTEATIICTSYAVSDRPAEGHPIGRPLDGVVVRLLDRRGLPVPIGLPGELFVGGPGVARGYLGRPELSAERFVALNGGRYYRTGDLARWTADGVLEFLGRADQQVKVRGFRVEIGEVESALAAHPGVREVAVDAREVGGERKLAAYLVLERGAGATAAELRRFAQAELPEYMVPAYFVLLDRLPLGATGKVDRRALPAPEGAVGTALAVAYEAPRTRNEQLLASLFAEVFSQEQVGIHDNFFELGGDSLVALKVVGKASRLGLSITPRLLVENPTVARLAAKVSSVARIKVERGPVKGTFPLTPVQQLFFAQAPADPNHFNMAQLLEVRRALDPRLAAKVLRQVMAHHDALRLRFDRDGAGWKQTNLLPDDRPPVGLVDLGGIAEERQAAAIEAVAFAIQRSLDITAGPLLRMCLIELGGGRHGRMMLVFHHLVVDLLSMQVVLEDLGLAFEAAIRGEAIVLPPKTTSYKYWSERLEKHTASGALDSDLAYWLAPERMTITPLPIDFPAGSNREAESRRELSGISAEETHALLREVPKAYRMQAHEMLLAALAMAVARWSGQRRILVDLEGHGREQMFDDADVSRTVGWFTAVYPVLLDVGDSLAPDAVLKAIKEQLRAVPNRGMSYGMLRYLSADPERRERFLHLPEAEIAFNYRGGYSTGARGAAERGGAVPSGSAVFAAARESAGEEFDPRLVRSHRHLLNAWLGENELRLAWNYGSKLHRKETIERLLGLVVEALRELIGHCLRPEVGGCTPSDFPLAGLAQKALDGLIGSGRDVEEIYPLTPLQSGMLFHALMAPAEGMFVNQTSAEILGELDLDIFRRSWQEVIERHPVLRTGFAHEGLDRPLQIVRRSATLPIEVEDWSDLSEEEALQQLEAYLAADLARGYDLARPPLMRIGLMKRSASRWHVVWSCHHILVDGESQSRVFEEVGTVYEVRRRGVARGGQEAPRPYRDYIAWLAGQDLKKAEEHWREALGGVVGATPLLLEPSGDRSLGVRERRLAFTLAERDGLAALARRARVTPNTVAQGAWALLLARYCGEPEVLYGLTVFGRPPELEGSDAMVGMFINTLPVRIDVPVDDTLGSWLRRLQERQLAMREFEHTPLPDIRRWAGLPPQRELFFNILVAQGVPESEGDEAAPGEGAARPAASLRIENIQTRSRTNVPLMANVVPGHWLSIAYESGRFDPLDVDRALGHWRALFAAFLAEGEGALGSFAMLSEAERHQTSYEWNDSALALPEGAPVPAQVRRRAAAAPAAPAIEAAGEVWTFGDLERFVAATAQALAARGVGRADRVGVALERSLELAAMPLAVWRLGAVYVPLDPASPPARRRDLARDAELCLAVVGEALRAEWQPAAQGLALATLDDLAAPETPGGAAAAEPLSAPALGDLAYLIYTSGTTGGPKAVAVEHGQLVATIEGARLTFGFGPGDRMLHVSPFTFDISLFELLAPLASGAAVRLLLRDEVLDPAALADGVAAATRLHAVPSLMREIALAAGDGGAGGAVRTAFVGGERVSSEVLSAMAEGLPAAERIVLYGPTEATIICAAERIVGPARGSAVGRPLPNVELKVVGASGTELPIGVGGELWIGGPGVARGYWRRPELTAERFVERGGRRFYRTGDRVRWTSAGSLEFLGRLDEQVKVRGIRVELGEVEEALAALPGVREAAVLLREDRPGDRRLVGYLALDALAPAGAEGGIDELRRRLGERLPEYMVPAFLVPLDRLPRLANGKVDRRALPAPEATAPRASYEPPRTGKEERLAAIFSDVLGVSRVGVHDDFFALGGDSLLALKIVGRARREGLSLGLRQLFEQPTIAALAGLVGEGPAVLAEQGPVVGPAPLTPIQRRFFASAPGDPHRFNLAVLLEIRRPLNGALARRVLGAILAHHDALRLRFAPGPAGWSQRFADLEGPAPVSRIDLSRLPEGVRTGALEAAADAVQASLDLARGPIVRLALFDLGGQNRGRLLLCSHHLAMDPVSLDIVLEDLGQALAALDRGAEISLPPKTTSFRQWAEKLAAYALGDEVAAELPYWTDPARSRVRALPVDFPGIGVDLAGDAKEAVGRLSEEETAALFGEAPKAYRMEPREILLAALALAVERFAGDGLVLVDVEGHGREDLFPDVDLSRTVGWFTSIYPTLLDLGGVRTAADGERTAELLKSVKEQLRAVPRRGIGYGVLRWLRGVEELARLPQAEIGFNFSGSAGSAAPAEATGRPMAAAEAPFAWAGEDAGAPVGRRERRPYPFQFELGVAGGGLRCALTYGARHRSATAQRWVALYLEALRELIDHCVRAEVGGATPSDFPLAGVGQADLDRLIGTGREGREIEDIYPLTPLQQGMLFHALMAPAAGMYVNQMSGQLVGEPDLGLFRQAWQEVLARHPVLRSGFAVDGLERPLQIVWRRVEMPIEVIDLEGRTDEEAGAALKSYLEEDLRRGFRFERPPLLRVALLRRSAALHDFVWSCHHILVDGESQSRVFEEVGTLYELLRAGRPAALPAPRPYRDYIAWLERRDPGQAEALWRSDLAGIAEATSLPFDAEPGEEEAGLAVDRSLALSPAETERLAELARRERVTFNTVVQAGFSLLLARYAGVDDVLYGLTVFGRPTELERADTMVGMFINTLPVRLRVPGAEVASRWLRGIQDHQLALREREHTPLVDVQRWSEIPAGEPLFRALLVFQERQGRERREPLEGGEGNSGAPAAPKPSLEIRNLDLRSKSSFPLAAVPSSGTELTLRLTFDHRRFEAATIDRLLGHWRRLLGSLAASSDVPLLALEIFEPAERAQLLEWNDRRRPFPRRDLFGLFAEQAERRPEAPAVDFSGTVLSYGDLRDRALRLGRRLRRHGLGLDDRVGVLFDRSPELIVATLGALAAGAAYVPLDPGYPAERLAWMVRDSGAAVVLTLKPWAVALPELDVPVLALDDLEAELALAAEPAPWRPVAAPPEALAYVVYTSGSTGEPKGIGIPQSAVCRLVLATDFLPFGAAERIGHASNVSFDAATFEIWGALLHGGTVVGVARDVALDPLAFSAALEAGRVTSLFLTTALFQQIVREAPQAFARLGHLLFGGEAVDASRVRELLAGSGRPARLLHVYGPTESTTFATWHPVAEVAANAITVPIGRPLANTTAYVVDLSGRPVPPGATGELWLGGDGLARGYLGRPDLSAERFTPDPWGEAGTRVYRTGDRVRLRPDGEIEFRGRLDGQVKLRGFRIELGEVEAALRRLPGVREAAAVVREDPSGDRTGGRRLVGYVAADEGQDLGALRRRLAENLPDYMVPSALVRVDRLPLTPNGKVDRRALPAPHSESAARAVAPPRTAVEQALMGVWSEVLGVPQLGIHDDFFSLGGHSLIATRLMSRVRSAFQVELPLRDLFEEPTIAGLARRLEAARRTGLGLEAPPLVPADRAGRLPLSFAQQRLWFLQQLDPESPAYNLALPLRVRGPLDLDLLDACLGEIVRRHEVLRTTFETDAFGEPEQRIAPAGRFRAFRIDLSGLPAGRRESALLSLVAIEGRRPYDLARERALRAEVFRLAAGEHAVLVGMHHVASDGWSMEVLTREVGELYRAGTEGRPARLAALPIQYADFAAWQRRWLAGETLAREVEHWRGVLAGAPEVTDLPLDRPRTEGRGFAGASRGIEWSVEETRAFHDLGRREGATLFMVALAGLDALLARYAGPASGPRLSVGTPIAGRNREEVEPLIGFFVNTLVIHADLEGDPTFVTVLARVREAALAAYDHQDLPFEKLVEELQPERTPSHSPLFQVVFALQMAATGGREAIPIASDLTLSPLGSGEAVFAKYDLSVTLEERAGRLGGSLDYARDLFDAPTVGRMARHLSALLTAAAQAPDLRLSELPLLGAAERHQLVAEWNDTASLYPRRGLFGLFVERAEQRPAAPAIEFAAGAVSYGELRSRAERVGAALHGLGVGIDDRVGVLFERSPEMFVATLGALAAGAAYVPLDPSYPSERLGFMVRDAGVAAVLTVGGLAGLLEGVSCPVLSLDELEPRLAAAPRQPVPVLDVPDSALAYVIYTSGSTGEPKGIAISQGAVCRLVLGSDLVAFGPEARYGHVSNVSFDAATFEIWGALLHGAVAVGIPRETVLDPPAFAAALESARVTSMFLTAALFNQMIGQNAGAFAGLVHLLVGGEALDPSRVREALAGGAPPRHLLNGYGPTESTTFAVVERIGSVAAADRSVPIGRPIANTSAQVVDAAGRPAPIGVAGELWLGGDGLARGYFGRPDLTADRFVPDPFGPAGGRAYRTGDLVRRLADGRIDYLGRLDGQVKLRGFRIELGEIEAALARVEGVRQAAAVMREDRPGEKQLVAYVTGESAPTEAELRARVAAHLPDFMVPRAFVHLERLPLTPNGKLDRRALPAPEADPARGGGEPAAARTATERALAEIWSEVLGVARVGIHDDFFALGGHSLLATRLMSRVRTAFQTELPLRDLFEAPTIAGLARRLESSRRAGLGLSAPPLVPVERTGELPLSFAQRRLWFLEQLEPGTSTYNMPMPLKVTGALDLDRLDAALSAIVARHEVLRTTFALGASGEPEQRIAPAARFRFARLDLLGLSEVPRVEALRRLVGLEAARPFDLAAGPVLRGMAARVAREEHAVLFTMHHVASDGWSMEVLTREVGELYRASVEGRPARLAGLPIQYADYARWQRDWLGGETLAREIEHWRGVLAGAPEVTELPLDRPRPEGRSGRGGHREFALGAEETMALQELGRREGATLFMVGLFGVQALLARYAGPGGGAERINVGTPVAGRSREELEPLIGFFVNTLVMSADFASTPEEPEPTAGQALRRVRETALSAFDHQDLPFEKLVEEIQPGRDLTRTPLFQVMFLLQMSSRAEGEAPRIELPGGLEIAPLGAGGVQSAQFDLLFQLRAENTIQGELIFSPELFDVATIDRLSRQYRRLLSEVASAPDRGLWDLPLLEAAEELQIAAEWGVGAPAPPWRSLLDQFDDRVAARPEATAVLDSGRALSYGELDGKARRLALALVARGVGPEVRVGLFSERSAPAIAAILAIWRAGGVYVPLDPKLPADRLRFVAEDARLALVLADRAAGALPANAPPALPIEGIESGAPAPALPSAPLPEQAAYLIYTSGSSGWPKGVVVAHRGLGQLARVAVDRYALAPGDRLLFWSALSFDASMWDLALALCSGATLCVEPAEQLLPGPDLLRTLKEREISIVALTPSALRALPAGDLPHLAQLVAGGEECGADLVAAWRARTRMTNEYGPTEASVTAGWWGVPPDFAGVPPIGRAVPGAEMRVLDRRLAPLPPGAPGEILLGGAGLARGYFGRPDLTAERFVPSPFGPAGARLYRTGDLGRLRADGEVLFLGRVDAQVKLRGFRIELGEVEAALAEIEGVAAAAAAIRPDRSGDPRLVAYLVGAEAIDVPKLRSLLASRLPDAMVPGAVVPLERLPRTPNGKLDRAALPAPDLDGRAGADLAPPRTATETALAGLWSEVLGLDRVGIFDDFFALGGHSLLATRLMARIRTAFQVELPLRGLFEAPTIAGLARRLESARREGLGLEAPPLVAAPRERGLPLSFAQQRLWFLQQLEPESAAYNMPMPLEVTGPLDLDRLDAALTSIVRRHEVLRTTFDLGPEGEPEQRIAPPAPFRFLRADLSALAAESQERALRRLTFEVASRPFDLARGPVVRGVASRLAEARHAVVFCMHHVASDGWSMEILTREVAELYRAGVEGRPARLPELPIQYADYALWQRSWLRGEVLAREVEHWRDVLAGAPEVTELPLDRPRREGGSGRGASREIELDLEATQALRSLGQREGATLFMVGLFGVQALLARYAGGGKGETRINVGTPVAGRSREELEPMIGFFVNTLVASCDLGPDQDGGEPTVSAALRRVRETALTAFDHQDLPFEKLVEELQPERNLTHNPLFQVMFQLQMSGRAEGGEPPMELPGGLAIGRLGEAGVGNSPFDLQIQLRAGRLIEGELMYSVERFDGATIERLGRQLRRLLVEAAAAPDRNLWDLPLLEPGERQQIATEWSVGASPGPWASLVDQFARQVAARPEAPALLAGGTVVSYRDLDRRSNRLARRLADLGVGVERRVGVFLERGIDLPVAILAIWKAGGAYLPLEPKLPAERLRLLVDDARPHVLLTSSALLDAAPGDAGRTVVLDTDTALKSEEPVEPWAAELVPEQAAYVIYTSGSTGRPKGVVVAHGGLGYLAAYLRDEYAAGERSRVLQFTSVSFDVSLWELAMALAAGGALCLEPAERLLPGIDLFERLQVLEITHATFTPSALALLPDGDLPHLARLTVAGEVCPEDLAARFSRRLRFANAYGPTEATVCVSQFEVPPGFTGKPSIGRPFPATSVWVLDRRSEPMPVQATGELFLGGHAVARGYLDRPDLTAERFVPDPFGPPGARLYRTGDLGRLLADGRIDYLGRADRQIKLRGFRIEIGEIEAAMAALAGVRECAVALVETAGERRLVGFWVPAAEGAPDEETLRASLRRNLPDYMVPSRFVRLDSFPLAPSGKVDRRALVEVELGRADVAGTLVPARDDLERGLVEIWSELLGRPVGIRDNFFEAGGHSLLAVRLMSKIQGALGRSLPVSALFHGPTVEGLARLLRRGEGEIPTCLVPIRSGGELPPLFIVHGATGQVLRYGALAERLAGPRPIFGLQSEGLDGVEAPLTRIDDMARHYLRQVRGEQPVGPYHLAGWSLGGLVAYEMACQLEAAGERVAFVGVIDAHLSGPDDRLLMKDAIAMLATFAQDFGLNLKDLGIGLLDLEELTPNEQVRVLVERAKGVGAVPMDIEVPQIQRLYEVFRANAKAILDLDLKEYSGEVRYYHASEAIPRYDEGLAGRLAEHGRRLARQGLTPIRPWQKLLGKRLIVRRVSGHHFSMLLPPHVDSLAAELRNDLAKTEGED